MGISGRTLGEFRRDFRGISGRLFRGIPEAAGRRRDTKITCRAAPTVSRDTKITCRQAAAVSRDTNFHVPGGRRRISRYKMGPRRRFRIKRYVLDTFWIRFGPPVYLR